MRERRPVFRDIDAGRSLFEKRLQGDAFERRGRRETIGASHGNQRLAGQVLVGNLEDFRFEAHRFGQQTKDLGVAFRLPEGGDRLFIGLHIQMSVRAVKVKVLELRRGRQDDVGVVGGVGLKLIVHDREQVLAGEAAHDLGLLRIHRRRVGVVNVQGPDRRPRQFAMQRLGQVHHVDRPGAWRNQVGAFEGVAVPGHQFAGAQHRAAARMTPGSDDRGQADDRPHRHAAAAMALHAVVGANQGRAAAFGHGAGVFMGQFLNIGDGDAGDACHRRRGVFVANPRLQFLRAEAVAFEIVLVLQTVPEQDVHHAQGQGAVGPRADGNPPVAFLRRLAAVRINGDDLRAGLAGPVHQRPLMHVGDGGVRPPVDDVPGEDRVLGVDDRPRAEGDIAAHRPGGGADRPVEQAGAESVEKPPVKAGVMQFAHRAGIAVRQDRLGAVRAGGNLPELAGDGRDCLGPGDRLEFALALFADAAQGPGQTIGMVNAVEVMGDLGAQIPVGEGVLLVAANLGGPAVIDGHADAAGVGAVMRTDGPDHVQFGLHAQLPLGRNAFTTDSLVSNRGPSMRSMQ